MTSYSDRVTHLQSFLADRPGSTTSYNAEAVLLSDVKALAEDADREIGEARADVVRMAESLVGAKCEHHKQPLEVLEREALKECPICWRECAKELETKLAKKDSQIAELNQKYHELLLSVSHKYQGETRHETAQRYIRQAEISHSPASAECAGDSGKVL